jgi:hypothetical protein
LNSPNSTFFSFFLLSWHQKYPSSRIKNEKLKNNYGVKNQVLEPIPTTFQAEASIRLHLIPQSKIQQVVLLHNNYLNLKDKTILKDHPLKPSSAQ